MIFQRFAIDLSGSGRYHTLVMLRERSHKKEILDLETPPVDEVFEAYRLIACVNRFLWGTDVILGHFKKFARQWDKNKTIWILDVGTGSCDIPKAIVRWAKPKGYKIKIVGLDLSSEALAFALENVKAYPEISLVRGSVFSLPFQQQSFDYAISSLFFHHLSDDEIPSVLKYMDELIRKGLVINDLLRRFRAYLWISFFSLWTKNRIFKTDAPLSVLRGFKPKEIEALIKKSGLNYLKFHYHFAHRFAIAGEKR